MVEGGYAVIDDMQHREVVDLVLRTHVLGQRALAATGAPKNTDAKRLCGGCVTD